jgi:tripartite-type tricarboxylate transporter receptor subunit TctC
LLGELGVDTVARQGERAGVVDRRPDLSSIRSRRMPLGSRVTMVRSSLTIATIAAVAAWTACAPAAAQDYPVRPIKIIVPVTPGGFTDLLPRILGQKITELTGQAVVVENRPGGGGSVATEEVIRSPADGYTLMMGLHAVLAILPHLSSTFPYDPAKVFAPIVLVAKAPSVLTVHPAVPARSVQELIGYAKARPGLTFSSSGIGSVSHIAGEQLKQMTGIDIVHVPYKGPAQAAQDVVAGHVTMMFDSVPLVLESIRAGRVRALAVTSRDRVEVLPEVPTIAEAGLPGLEAGVWFALVAPTGTPMPVVAWLNRTANTVFGDPDVRQRFARQGATLPLGTPESLAQFIDAESRKYADVIRRAGIKLE